MRNQLFISLFLSIVISFLHIVYADIQNDTEKKTAFGDAATGKFPPFSDLKKHFSNPQVPEDYPMYVILKFRDEFPVRAFAQGTDTKAFEALNIRSFSPLLSSAKSLGNLANRQLMYVPHMKPGLNGSPPDGDDDGTSDNSKEVTSSVKNELDRIMKRLQESDIDEVVSLFQSHLNMIRGIREQNSKDGVSQLADLENFYRIRLKDEASAEGLIRELGDYSIVETVYAAPIPQNADILPITPNLQPNQAYLNAAPAGISALSAWNVAGGDGSGVTIIDIEAGWNFEHEDLDNPVRMNGINLPDTNHGTAVLGVMVAKNDGAGMTGIAFNANYGTTSVVRSVINWWSVADAVINAVNNLNAGDIILIEQHSPDYTPFNSSNDGTGCSCNCDQHRYLPMEYFPAEFWAIRYATDSGITVVEAAGNGGQNLDHANFNSRFQRATRDSGAILVGAGGGSGNLSATCWSNFGSRVDVQGWGRSVATLGYGNGNGLAGSDGRHGNTDDDARQWYTGRFSGTSSASPIVTGAAAVLQGIKLNQDSVPLSPAAMRTLLVNNSTPQTGMRNIGPQPRLDNAVTALLGQPAQTPTIGNTCTTPAAISDECGGNSCVEQLVGTEYIPPGPPSCFLIIFCDEPEGYNRLIYENVCIAP